MPRRAGSQGTWNRSRNNNPQDRFAIINCRHFDRKAGPQQVEVLLVR
ncbi:hypothetical protein C731_4737 [Mycolicibacterium hassiacum DSM 44199]|uniref:Uncharacterized protein n=1 Tax=Mycolicibacterium hassiacum (strain DSM 44199 / CIP 105218 / JCM 12690 / 3849) TaxID=1122247 RepID=K5B737_MYCHD|nr:hypothetical protein C731_4737 [Mycolicibacterium hassiacum DSM 44199]